jgi:hypothetical protein
MTTVCVGNALNKYFILDLEIILLPVSHIIHEIIFFFDLHYFESRTLTVKADIKIKFRYFVSYSIAHGCFDLLSSC